MIFLKTKDEARGLFLNFLKMNEFFLRFLLKPFHFDCKRKLHFITATLASHGIINRKNMSSCPHVSEKN